MLVPQSLDGTLRHSTYLKTYRKQLYRPIYCTITRGLGIFCLLTGNTQRQLIPFG